MCDHGHSHDHGDCGKEANSGVEWSLYTKIDLENLSCLNEEIDGSGRKVFKPWELRQETSEFVDSDGDEELLFNIPFTGCVKLKGIMIKGGPGDSHPKAIRLFKNKYHMTFDDVRLTPDQEMELAQSVDEVVYTLKAVKFPSVNHLSIHIPENFGADNTRVYYIGLRGEYIGGGRQEAVIATYEARPVPKDHKGMNQDPSGHTIF